MSLDYDHGQVPVMIMSVRSDQVLMQMHIGRAS